MKMEITTDGVSGGRTAQASIRGVFLRVRRLRNREAEVMEQWSIGLLRLSVKSITDYRRYSTIRISSLEDRRGSNRAAIDNFLEENSPEFDPESWALPMYGDS